MSESPHVCFADVPKCEPIVIKPKAEQQRYWKQSSISPSCISPTPMPTSATTLMPTPRYERNLGFFQQLSRRFGLRSNDDLVNSTEDDMHSSSTDSCSSTTGSMPPMQSSATSMSSTSSNSNTHSSGSNPNSHIILKEVHDFSIDHISCASSETSSTIDFDEQQLQLQNSDNGKNNSNISNTSIKDCKLVTRASFSRLHRCSTSSIRRAFESFSLSSRSLSCSGSTPPLQRADSSHHNTNDGSNDNIPVKSALKRSSSTDLNKKCINVIGNSASASITNSKSSKSKPKPPPQRILRQPVSYTYLKGISGLPTQRVPRSSVCCQYARR